MPPLGDGSAVGTLVLLGFAGPTQWPRFVASPECHDGLPNPLDRWSRRVINALAPAGAMALYPFDGPPWWPFPRWARRAEPVHASPLGVLLHPDWGPWHAYRGALALRARLRLPAPDERASPCLSCAAMPCVAACPARAVARAGFDATACVTHVASGAGSACRAGCLARGACPVGREFRYGGAQARFHMRALLDSPEVRRRVAGRFDADA
ncbi:MAG TPA: hypothetical protein VMU33_15010 [Burkholderiaceae bacterium]|nr:hypothetical protein [Burkholderiaceae bacterium]